MRHASLDTRQLREKNSLRVPIGSEINTAADARSRTLRSSNRRVGSGWYRPVGDDDRAVVIMLLLVDIAERAVYTPLAERPRAEGRPDMKAGAL